MNARFESQADTLRIIAGSMSPASPAVTSPQARKSPGSPPYVIAVASGKGGVGKTSLIANLAVAYGRQGLRVLALDGDLGLANLDMLLGIRPKHTFLDLMSSGADIDDILTPGPEGITVLPGCSGRYELANLSDQDRRRLFGAVDVLGERFDMLLVDTAAGIGSNAVYFAGAARQVVVVATPEPTSLADAYALIKILWERCRVAQVHLVANMVSSAAEGDEVYRRLCVLADRFLGVGIDYLGAVTRDQAVVRSIHAQIPLLIHDPNAAASRCIETIARKLTALTTGKEATGGISLFWERLLGQGSSA